MRLSKRTTGLSWLRRTPSQQLPGVLTVGVIRRPVVGILSALGSDCVSQLSNFVKGKFHLCCIFSVFCITPLSQKPHVTSTFFGQVNLILKIIPSMSGLSKRTWSEEERKKKKEGFGLQQWWTDTLQRLENSSLFVFLPLNYLITLSVSLCFAFLFLTSLAFGFVTG